MFFYSHFVSFLIGVTFPFSLTRTFTQPDVPHQQNYPEGFQGNAIPVNGATVAKLVHKRLTLGLEESES